MKRLASGAILVGGVVMFGLLAYSGIWRVLLRAGGL
jgi:hypothetical protein